MQALTAEVSELAAACRSSLAVAVSELIGGSQRRIPDQERMGLVSDRLGINPDQVGTTRSNPIGTSPGPTGRPRGPPLDLSWTAARQYELMRAFHRSGTQLGARDEQ